MLYSSQVCWLERLVVIFATPHFSQWGCSWRATFVGGCVNLRREALPGCVLCLWDLLGFSSHTRVANGREVKRVACVARKG